MTTSLSTFWQTASPPIPQGGAVNFVLTNEEGAPIVGQLISLRLYGLVDEDRVDEKPVGSCLTNSLGRCSVTVHHPDYAADLTVTAFVADADDSVAILAGWGSGGSR